MIRKLLVASIAIAALTVSACQQKEETKLEEAPVAATNEVAVTPSAADVTATNMATNEATATTTSMGSTTTTTTTETH